MPELKPCTCWAEVALHDDHCCFGYDWEVYSPVALLHCGHDHEGFQIMQAYEESLEADHA